MAPISHKGSFREPRSPFSRVKQLLPSLRYHRENLKPAAYRETTSRQLILHRLIMNSNLQQRGAIMIY